MILHLSTAVRNARSAALRAALDADASPGYIEFYTAPQPATGGAAITTQTKMGTLTLSKPSGTISNGVLTFSTIADDIAADASGDIAWARFYDGAGAWVMDGDCGDTASAALLRFGSVSALEGGAIRITSGALTEGDI